MATEYGSQNTIVGFKEEVSMGTFIAPVAADYDIEFFDVSWPETDPGMSSIGKPANGTLHEGKMKSGAFKESFSGKTALTHSGVHTTAPKIGKVLKSAGLIQSGGGASPIVYTFDGSMPCNTLSAVVSEMNCGSSPVSIDKKVRGIQSSLVIAAAGTGKEFTCEYKFTGAYEDEVDNASPIKTILAPNTITEKFLGTVFTIGSQAFIALSMSLDLANTVSLVSDPVSKKGYKKGKITGKACKLALSVYKMDVLTSGLPLALSDDTAFTSIKFVGKYYTIEILDANLSNRKDGNADGLVSEELEFQVRSFTITANSII